MKLFRCDYAGTTIVIIIFLFLTETQYIQKFIRAVFPVYYDLTNAKMPDTKTSSHEVHESMTSLLQLRHRVHPGMLMMFCRGQLYFANEIFDGYGISRQDFFRQLDRTKRDVDKNDWLPEDFKFGQPIKKKHEKGKKYISSRN